MTAAESLTYPFKTKARLDGGVGAVLVEVRGHAGLLAGGELLVAGTVFVVSHHYPQIYKSRWEEGNILIRVIHIVVDRIKTSLARARVTAGRAATGSGSLGRGISDVIAVAGAAALEGVVETEPVADLVGGGVAEVVVGEVAAGQGVVQDGAAVVVPVVGLGGDRGGEVAVAESVAEVLEDVQVEVLVGALAERLLHGQLGAVNGPVAVDGVVGALEGELDAVGGVGGVEDGDLVVNHGGLDNVLVDSLVNLGMKVTYGNVATAERGGRGNDVEVDVDVDGGLGRDTAGGSESSLLLSNLLGHLDVLARGSVSTAVEGLDGADGSAEGGGGSSGREEEGLDLHDELKRRGVILKDTTEENCLGG